VNDAEANAGFRRPVRPEQDDLLWQHLRSLPAFRALLRAVEARFYQHIDLPDPILDLGCGDGKFVQLGFPERRLAAGIDPWWGPLQKARRSEAYQQVLQSLGHRLPFPDSHFATVISNSVLEHIPDVQSVLNETGRVTRPGGRLVITMPNHNFTRYLDGAMFFERLGLQGMADWYRRSFNRIARHAHTDPAEAWAARLAKGGFSVERWQYYFSVPALHALEMGHMQGLPSAVLHFLTGHWIVAPWKSSLSLTERWVRPYFEEEQPEIGTMLLIIARKEGAGPITPLLPAMDPLDLSLPEPVPVAQSSLPDTPIAAEQAELLSQLRKEVIPDQPSGESQPPPRQYFPGRVVTISLLLLSLFSAVLGQFILSNQTETPAEALPWFALSFLFLALLTLWAGNWAAAALTLPRAGPIARRRWLVLLSLLSVLVANGQVNSPIALQRPVLALYLWLLAIGLALFALWPRPAGPRMPSTRPRLTRWEWAFIGGSFLVALALRAVNLTAHPFILNGSEASIGLDAWTVTTNQIGSPFATGWLANPTLPSYILAIPIRLLGRTILAVRILSPLIGALAVPAIYLFGRRLWGPPVGLVAALLLAGSHLYLHYSRLGMTNIWDPLLTMIALGLAYSSWQSRRRELWLLFGLATGVSAYWYTVSHLLPLMLTALLLLLLLHDRRELWQQRWNLLTAGLMALVVSLPILLFYRSNPGVFTDRLNVLGIFQSNWFVQEGARTGQNAAQVLIDQFWRALLAFNYGLDTSPAYNPGRPLLSLWPAVLLVLGVGLSLWRWRQLRYRLLLVWFGVVIIFAAFFLESPPNSHRLLVAVPAVYLFVALGLGWIVQQSFAIFHLSRRYLALILVILALLLAARDVAFYFGPYQNAHRFADRNSEIAHEMSLYLNDLDGPWTVYFYGAPAMYTSFPTFAYLVEEWQSAVQVQDVEGTNLLPPAAPDSRTVYIYVPDRSAELTLAQETYPEGQMRVFEGHHASPLFYVYEVQP
jgi:SAM-dependent methyltransferase/4-amino-4-deoxy-L-arabinose transferase-like glycosyltransferase